MLWLAVGGGSLLMTLLLPHQRKTFSMLLSLPRECVARRFVCKFHFFSGWETLNRAQGAFCQPLKAAVRRVESICVLSEDQNSTSIWAFQDVSNEKREKRRLKAFLNIITSFDYIFSFLFTKLDLIQLRTPKQEESILGYRVVSRLRHESHRSLVVCLLVGRVSSRERQMVDRVGSTAQIIVEMLAEQARHEVQCERV